MQVLRLLRKVARHRGKNERHTFNGQEVWQEEHDLLQALRQKNFQLRKRQMQLLWFWEKQKVEKLQVAEEVKIRIFLNQVLYRFIMRRCRSGQI